MTVLCGEKNVVLAIAESAPLNPETGNYQIGPRLFLSARAVQKCCQVENVPDGVEPEKYRFVDGVFMVNPEYQEPEPEPRPTPPPPAPDEDRDAMLVDLEYRTTLLELGVI